MDHYFLDRWYKMRNKRNNRKEEEIMLNKGNIDVKIRGRQFLLFPIL